MSEVLASVGANVRASRNARGLTISVLAERSGVSRRFLVELENGRGNISIAKLSAIAAALGRSLASFLAPDGAVDLVDRVVAMSPAERLRLKESLSASRASSPRRAAGSIALLGVRGAGKSTVGRALALQLGMEFVELDARIEELSGLSLAEVFAIHGASYYREVEHDALTALLEETDCAVVATGGSLVTHTETWALLRRRMRTVWLQAEAQELWDRVIAQGDHRPMEQNPQAFAQLQELLELRMPLYQQAQYRVSTSDRAVQSVVSEVVRSLSLAGNSEGRSADR